MDLAKAASFLSVNHVLLCNYCHTIVPYIIEGVKEYLFAYRLRDEWDAAAPRDGASPESPVHIVWRLLC